MIKRIINKVILFPIFIKVVILSWILGISYVISYLRNPNPKITVRLLKYFGAKIGSKVTIKRSLFIDNAYEDQNSKGDFSYIKIGNNCYIGDAVYFDLSNKIIIEDNAVLSGKVSLITHSDCNRSEHLEKIFPRKCEEVIIKNGAWVGFGATMLAGSILNDKSVLAAHSLLKDKTESYSLYAGNPAVKIKQLIHDIS